MVATVEDTAISLPVSGPGSPAANDTDANGDVLTVTAVAAATGGAVAIVAGMIEFVPAADLCGLGAGGFDYTVSDGQGGSDVGHVTVDVTCVDDPPVAVGDAATVAEDAAGDGDRRAGQRHRRRRRPDRRSTGDPAGQRHRGDHRRRHRADLPARRQLLQQPTGGTPTRSPTPWRRRLDRDGVGDGDLRRRPAAAVDDAATVAEDAAATAIDVLANDTDVDGGPIAIASVTQPANGTVVITGGGSRPDLPARRQLLQHPARRHAGHVHLHPDAGGSTATVVGHGDLRRRPAGRRSTTRRRWPRTRPRRRSTCWPTTPTSTAVR